MLRGLPERVSDPEGRRQSIFRGRWCWLSAGNLGSGDFILSFSSVPYSTVQCSAAQRSAVRITDH